MTLFDALLLTLGTMTVLSISVLGFQVHAILNLLADIRDHLAIIENEVARR